MLIIRKTAFYVIGEYGNLLWSFLFNETHSFGWESQMLVPTHAAYIPAREREECRFLYLRAAAKWNGTSNRWLHCHCWGRRRRELFWFFCWAHFPPYNPQTEQFWRKNSTHKKAFFPPEGIFKKHSYLYAVESLYFQDWYMNTQEKKKKMH